MRTSPAVRRHLPKVRQLLVALVAVFCLGLIVIYSGRLLLGEQVRGQLSALQTRVAAEQQRQQEIQTLLAEADDPAAVEAFAREANLVRQGETVFVPFIVAPTPAPGSTDISTPAKPSRPNWRLWWDLLATPSRP